MAQRDAQGRAPQAEIQNVSLMHNVSFLFE